MANKISSTRRDALPDGTAWGTLPADDLHWATAGWAPVALTFGAWTLWADGVTCRVGQTVSVVAPGTDGVAGGGPRYLIAAPAEGGVLVFADVAGMPLVEIASCTCLGAALHRLCPLPVNLETEAEALAADSLDSVGHLEEPRSSNSLTDNQIELWALLNQAQMKGDWAPVHRLLTDIERETCATIVTHAALWGRAGGPVLRPGW